MGSEFEEWLEKEFPCHSHYDFETLFKYENWKVSLKKAYEAGFRNGWNQGIVSGRNLREIER